MKISFIIGTRPELIKVAPVIAAVRKSNINFDVVNTAQHKDLLDPYWSTFGIEPTHVLDVMVPGQSLASLTARAISQIQEYVDNVPERPSVILAQGDTTTVMAASMVSFYNKIKFAHLEAGLRSFDFENPFPEEYNRRIASISAQYYFCPTNISKANLEREGVDKDKIYVVGNTVVDSLISISKQESFVGSPWKNSDLEKIKGFKDSVLVTCHRRENQGTNLQSIIEAISTLALANPQVAFVWTLHPNPKVRQVLLDSVLRDCQNILLVAPLEYIDILKLLKTSACVISDSGGIQEEAPSFETPVIVMRETTERPEGVNAGVAFLVGSDKNRIIAKFNDLKSNPIDFGINPYGDGNSSQLIIDNLTK